MIIGKYIISFEKLNSDFKKYFTILGCIIAYHIVRMFQ